MKNPPSNARNDGLIPVQRPKIPHVTEQLSPSVATTETRQYHYRICVLRWRILHDPTKTPHASIKTNATKKIN